MRWQHSHGALVLMQQTPVKSLERVPQETTTAGAGALPPSGGRIPGFIIVVCVLVGVLGLVVLVLAGSSMLQGDFSASGTGRSGWISPPIAFLLGLGLALAPIAIIRQERGTLRRGTDAHQIHERWESVLSLKPDGVFIQEGPLYGFHPWRAVTPTVLDGLPEPGRAVLGHYLEHPEDRGELDSEVAVHRARSIS